MTQTYLKIAALVLGFAFACSSSMAQEMKYPETEKGDTVDTYFGIKVSDPFRWLETDVRNSDKVRDWVTAQNKLTFGYLKSLPNREKIESRLTELWNYEKYGTPFRVADKYYFSKNDGLQNQNVLYRMDKIGGEPTKVLDPNTWSKDGTVALGGLAFSDDGKHMAYGIQDGGSDWRKWRIMNTETGKLLDDELNWLKFGGISWTKDGKGFFYSRFPEPDKDQKFQSTNLNNKIYYHKLGTSQSEDQLIHEDKENPTWGFMPSVTEDGDYLVITVWQGTDDRYQVYYKSLKKEDSKIVKLIDNFENEYSFIENYGSKFYFKNQYRCSKWKSDSDRR